MTATNRRAARVLVLDDTGRVLLLRGRDPAVAGQRYWFTPGGGLAPGESLEQAAVRELAEETGLRLSVEHLGRPRWSEEVTFSFDGELIRQTQQFFLVRVPSFAAGPTAFTELEHRTIDDHRWWTLAELAACGQRYYPTDLIDRVRQLSEIPC